jgi:hypothetical protein
MAPLCYVCLQFHTVSFSIFFDNAPKITSFERNSINIRYSLNQVLKNKTESQQTEANILEDSVFLVIRSVQIVFPPGGVGPALCRHFLSRGKREDVCKHYPVCHSQASTQIETLLLWEGIMGLREARSCTMELRCPKHQMGRRSGPQNKSSLMSWLNCRWKCNSRQYCSKFYWRTWETHSKMYMKTWILKMMSRGISHPLILRYTTKLHCINHVVACAATHIQANGRKRTQTHVQIQ